MKWFLEDINSENVFDRGSDPVFFFVTICKVKMSLLLIKWTYTVPYSGSVVKLIVLYRKKRQRQTYTGAYNITCNIFVYRRPYEIKIMYPKVALKTSEEKKCKSTKIILSRDLWWVKASRSRSDASCKCSFSQMWFFRPPEFSYLKRMFFIPSLFLVLNQDLYYLVSQ